MFAEDANEMVIRILDRAKLMGEETDIEDGFDLYRQLATIRRLFVNTIPEYAPLRFLIDSNDADLSPVYLSHFMWKTCWKNSCGGGFV